MKDDQLRKQFTPEILSGLVDYLSYLAEVNPEIAYPKFTQDGDSLVISHVIAHIRLYCLAASREEQESLKQKATGEDDHKRPLSEYQMDEAIQWMKDRRKQALAGDEEAYASMRPIHNIFELQKEINRIDHKEHGWAENLQHSRQNTSFANLLKLTSEDVERGSHFHTFCESKIQNFAVTEEDEESQPVQMWQNITSLLPLPKHPLTSRLPSINPFLKSYRPEEVNVIEPRRHGDVNSEVAKILMDPQKSDAAKIRELQQRLNEKDIQGLRSDLKLKFIALISKKN